MKKAYNISILLLLLTAMALAGCKNAATSTNSNGKPADGNLSNSNQASTQTSANDNKAAGVTSANAPVIDPSNTAAMLFGTFAMSEVHSGGVVSMISQLKTEITFLADGTYTRVSKRNGNIYHTDAGQYRLEGNDHIVLLIKMAKQKVLNPPRERRHAFTLSRDGEELKMTSDDGKVAVFRKIQKA